jgi:hypothetical protein
MGAFYGVLIERYRFGIDDKAFGVLAVNIACDPVQLDASLHCDIPLSIASCISSAFHQHFMPLDLNLDFALDNAHEDHIGRISVANSSRYFHSSAIILSPNWHQYS